MAGYAAALETIMEQISEAFYEMCSLLLRRGYDDLKQRPGILHEKIDDKWVIDFNPHNKDLELEGVQLRAFSARISYNDFPVGIIGASGGAIIGSCEGSAENDFIDALKAA